MINGTAGARGAPSDQESATGLLGRLMNDATALLRNEVALAKSEFRETLNTLKAATASMAMPMYNNTCRNFVIVIPEKNKLQILIRRPQLTGPAWLFGLRINRIAPLWEG